MPDWKKEVRERMGDLDLPSDTRQEIIAELASHLEDCADAETEMNQFENRAIEQIQWHQLLRAIERTKRKEGTMNRRTKTLLLPAIGLLFAAGLILLFRDRAPILQRLIWTACTFLLIGAAVSESDRLNQRTRALWLPALLTFVGASVSLMLCQLLGMQPRLVWVAKIGMTFYLPWLATLPFFGAAGAYLSQRARGPLLARLAASLSPALVMITVMLVILPWGLYLDGFDFFRLVAFGLGVLNWFVIPALALLLGAAPFLKGGGTGTCTTVSS